jgi:hypothetical protein
MEEKINTQEKNNSSSESENSDIEDYKKLKEGDEPKKEKNLGKLLKTIVKKTKKIKGDIILSKNKVPLEKIKNEEIEATKRKEKKLLRNLQIKLGYVKYEDWDKKYEKKLLKVTRRGVVKFFNSIVEHRKKEMEIVKNEEKEAQKKSNNFLMIHNLDYLNPNMNVNNDNDTNKKTKENKNKKINEKNNIEDKEKNIDKKINIVDKDGNINIDEDDN